MINPTWSTGGRETICTHLRSHERRDDVLAFDTDIEELHAESDGHGDTGQVEGCRPVHGLDESVGAGSP
jgi:hypothetical protein